MAPLLNQTDLDTNGIPGLFSKEGFDIAYNQYQGHILQQLNDSTVGMCTAASYTHTTLHLPRLSFAPSLAHPRTNSLPTQAPNTTTSTPKPSS